MERYKKGFDIICKIFRLVGNSNLGFDYFQIFEYTRIFEYICEYFLRIIFLFVFVTKGVKNNIHIHICIICFCKQYSYSYSFIKKIIHYTLFLTQKPYLNLNGKSSYRESLFDLTIISACLKLLFINPENMTWLPIWDPTQGRRQATLQCTLHTAQCIAYSVQCTVYILQCTVNSVQFTVYSVKCKVYSVKCKV